MENIKQKIKDKNKEINQLLETRTMSVSKLIEYMHKEFDRDGVAKKCFEKGFDDPKSKYYQMDVKAILESWEAKATESKKYGSMMDNYIGTFLTDPDYLETWKLDNNYEYDHRIHGLCEGFNQFYKLITEKTDYKYVCREEKMFIKSNKTDEWINGRFDCLFYSEKLNKYLVIDWKTSGTIDKENKWEKLFGPLYDKDACNLNEYTIQVQMYKKALSEVYELAPPENIDVYICQFSIEPNEFGNHFQLYNQGFEYDSKKLDDIIEFAYKKSRIK